MNKPRLYIIIYDAPNKEDKPLQLEAAARLYMQLAGLSPRPLTLKKDAYGKPFFENEPDIRLSPSDSGKKRAYAFFNKNVGLDIEKHRACKFAEISRRFFTSEDSIYAQKSTETFFRVWTYKESYVKYTGAGIARSGFNTFSVTAGGAPVARIGEACFYYLPYKDGFSLTVCSEGEAEPVIIDNSTV